MAQPAGAKFPDRPSGRRRPNPPSQFPNRLVRPEHGPEPAVAVPATRSPAGDGPSCRRSSPTGSQAGDGPTRRRSSPSGSQAPDGPTRRRSSTTGSQAGVASTSGSSCPHGSSTTGSCRPQAALRDDASLVATLRDLTRALRGAGQPVEQNNTYYIDGSADPTAVLAAAERSAVRMVRQLA